MLLKCCPISKLQESCVLVFTLPFSEQGKRLADILQLFS